MTKIRKRFWKENVQIKDQQTIFFNKNKPPHCRFLSFEYLF
jgi:hypothetical protein